MVAFMKYQNIEALNRETLVELVDYIKVFCHFHTSYQMTLLAERITSTTTASF